LSSRGGSDEDFGFGVFFSKRSDDFIRDYFSLLGSNDPFSLLLLSISNQLVEFSLHCLGYFVHFVVFLTEVLEEDSVLG
jgi:hypothetical protein